VRLRGTLKALLCALLLALPVAAQQFSGLARVDAAQSHLREVRGGLDVQLRLSQGVPWRVYMLSDPARLVLDFREVDFGGLARDDLVEGEAVGALRMGPLRPGWSRLVAELPAPMVITSAELRVDPAATGALVQVLLEASAVEEMAQQAGAPPQGPGWDAPDAGRQALPRRDDGVLRVILDPGHGGIDPGAEAAGTNEATLMLILARELRETLLRADGFEVALTRDADVFVSLEARVARAQEAEADIFVSLHADALAVGLARGAAIYTLSDSASDAASAALAERHDRDDLLAGIDLSTSDDRVADVLMDIARLDTAPRSSALAEHLVAGIENAVGRVHKRPLRQAGFSVLKAADIPSVLIEVGFLSTPQDLRNLQDPLWRAGLIAGIRDGLQDWARADAAIAPLRRQ